ncbi:MAG: peptide ABC transporter substrate-binding protein [Anaerolineales bacterium]|nr:MAG: peptide ABC transporter substrate-binding protein [Anaerolineales bacterium]
MKHNRWFQIFALVVLASMILVACAPQATPTTPPTAEPTVAAPPTEVPPTEVPPTEVPATEAPTAEPTKNTVIIGVTDKLASLDPADAYAIMDWESIKNISEGLLRWKPGTLDLEPALATDMGTISEDGLTYTFTLKDGIKFADGTPLDATMYAAQLNRLLTIGPGATCPNGVAGALVTPYVQSITAPDAKTIVFTLKNKIGYFVQLLATAPYVVSDPKTFPADTCVLFPEAPIYGVGPWYISQFTKDEQIVFEPNPYYTGDLKPQVDQIIRRDYADAQTMALAVQNGEIDVAWRQFSPDQINPLKAIEGLNVATVPGGSIRFLILNHTMAPTDDPNVVKAIASAIDRNEIADTVYGGNVEPLYSMIPSGFLGADDVFDTMYAAPNLDAAKQFLAASGYTETNPLKLEMWYPPEHYGPSTAAWMELIKKQLEATGAIQVTLQAQEWSTYVTALTGGQAYAAGVLGWFFDYPDSSNYLDPFVYNGGEGTNVSPAAEGTDYGNPINDKAKQLVDLLAQADSETDQGKRADLYKQAADIYADLVASVPIFFNAEHIIYRTNITGTSTFAYPETLNVGPNIEFYYSLINKTP